jgi:thymidylate kinase
LIALVGGDGAGKSTVVNELFGWLSRNFHTVRVHLGKPARSATSSLVNYVWRRVRALRRFEVSSKPALMAAQGRSLGLRGFARLAWEVMTARDRYRQYVRARRLASNGVIVICDRYPLPQIKLMDGATATSLLAHPSRAVRYLARLEKQYYDHVLYPDVLIVLRVNPDLAVERKREEEGEVFVRPRSEEIWRIDWRGTPAVVIDAGRPKAEVLAQVKSLVWSRL